MKVIEMLSKGMKAIPISKKEEWKEPPLYYYYPKYNSKTHISNNYYF